ncbi:ABC transporter substrate-binding protein [Phytohabitans kaempferiae]|uniref:ABC transporter substrate-binding protein n=1 Tax=Phytohabitans kaempferiae TaxID=1620943 RepID=A0ABV6MA99_9ACTN
MTLTSPTRPAVLAAAALLTLSACAGGAAAPSGSGDGPPRNGGSLVFAITSGTSCLNPQASPNSTTTATIGRAIVDSLVAQDADGKLHPWLARKWEVVDGGRGYLFSLRDDVKFHDGTPFDAAAVKANFDHIVRPETKSQYAASLFGGAYTGTEVVDQHTAKVTFSRPFAPFLQAASTANLGIQSPKALAEFGDKLCAGGEYTVGTGPFRAERHIKNQSVDLVRNPDYAWGPDLEGRRGPAHVDRLTFRFLPEETVRVGALTSGQAQVAVLPVTSVGRVSGNPDYEYHQRRQPGESDSLFLNTSRAPFDDEGVRTAFIRAVDLDPIIKGVYFGVYERAWSPLSPATLGYDPTLEGSWKHDPAESDRLLDAAGWTGRDAAGYRTKDGRRLTVEWPYLDQSAQANSVGEAIQADVKKVGIELVRRSIDTGTYWDLLHNGRYDIWQIGYVRAEPDVLSGFFLSTSLPKAGGQNAARVSDQQVDAWLREGAASTDEAARVKAYQQVQRWAVEKSVVLPLAVTATTVGASRSVRGLVFDADGRPVLTGVWLAR